jgi:hypothetical protein
VTVRTRIAAGLAAAALALTGCADGGTSADPTGAAATAAGTEPVVLRSATLRPGQPVPGPVGTRLLTVTGAIAGTGVLDTAVLDRALLGGLTQVQLSTYEPWVKRDQTFRGVWLADLLAVLGAGRATAVRITALDDYAVTLTAADLAGGGILLATSDGAGAEIPVAQGGPTRIVFRKGIRSGANADQWIWSLRTIDVR